MCKTVIEGLSLEEIKKMSEPELEKLRQRMLIKYGSISKDYIKSQIKQIREP